MSRALPDFARLDADGRLIEVSPRLGALNARAGGRQGALIALPGLAGLARLASTMRVPVARTVLVADGEADAEITVHAHDVAGGIELVVDEWRSRPARSSWLIPQHDISTPAATAKAWTWATDARLRYTEVAFEEGDDGAHAPDIVGLPLTHVLRLLESDSGDLPLLVAAAAGEAFDGQRAVRRDQPDREIVLSGRPVYSPDGRVTGFRGDARRAALGLVDTTTTGGVDFARRLTDAFRRPLDRIITCADSIGAQRDGPLRRDYVDYAGDIASAGRHLLDLIDDLADLEAVERADLDLEIEPMDLADVARRAAGLLSVRAADRGIRIDRPAFDETMVAYGDFRRVLQILVNLVGNAVRYSPDGGMVWLRTERDGETAVVVVADQGRGIAAADQSRIFDKFERLDPSDAGGSGLGLYIARRLARAMNGDITVDSAPGQGARFMLTLPAA